MALPYYVSTEWEGVGHVTLRFRPKIVPFVEKPKKKNESGEAVDEPTPSWRPWLLASLPSFLFTPKTDQHTVKTDTINCYLSTVYIREYGERKKKESENPVNCCQENTGQEASRTHNEHLAVDLRPPGITSEVWSAWLEHWSAWSEVLIPLSWVHKYRNHCTPEYISWHDSYLESYPNVLPLITDELGISELKEESLNVEEINNENDLEAEDLKQEGNLKQQEDSQEVQDINQTDKSRQQNSKLEDNTKQRNDLIQENNLECEDKSTTCEIKSCDSKDILTDRDEKDVNFLTGMKEELHCTSQGGADGMDSGFCNSSTKESTDKEILDDLYAKHVTKRYLVHLRSFLHQCGMEWEQEVDEFFKREAGIAFNISDEGANMSNNAAEEWNGDSKQDSNESENQDNATICDEVETLNATNGECNGNINPDKIDPQRVAKENTSLTNCNAGNEADEPEQLRNKSEMKNNSSIDEPSREYNCINLEEINDNRNDAYDEDEELQHRETEPEKDTQITTEQTHQSITSHSHQERSEKDEDFCGDGEAKEHVSNGRAATERSSSSDERNVKDDKVDNASGQNKTSKKKKRKRNNLRQQGVSEVLKYLQKNIACENHFDSQPSNIAQISEVSCEINQQSVEKNNQVTFDGSINTPSRSSLVEVMITNEKRPETREVSFDHADNLNTYQNEKEGTDDKSLRIKPIPWTKEDEEERVAFESFFDEMDQVEKMFWKKYYKEQEIKGIKEMLKKPPTLLSKIRAFCSDAIQSFGDIYLYSTALHFVNIVLPGTAVMEYISPVTEDEPLERRRVWFTFDHYVEITKRRMKQVFDRTTNFCKTNCWSLFLPVCVRHLSNLVLTTDPGIELEFPRRVFGLWWLPDPNAISVGAKSLERQQRRFHRWLSEHNKDVDPSHTVRLRDLVMYRVTTKADERKFQRLYQKVVREETDREESNENNTAFSTFHLTVQTIHPLNKSVECGGSDVEEVLEWEPDGTFSVKKNSTYKMCGETKDEEEEAWQKIVSGCQRLSFWEKDSTLPRDLPKEIQKYWAQRYRYFIKYDEGIKLDEESWYSVTPEFMAAHQARRCRCEVVVDAMCGAGGNAIQLAKTCRRVIAIDKDPKKVELARHNAQIYGVADHIDFQVGDFFKLAPYLKADVVYLSPPWGGIKYLEEEVYDVYQLGRTMNCVRLLRAARTITNNLALYLPRNSDICQVIALAGVGGSVDIETSYMGSKMKAITAYFGDLAHNNRTL